MRTQDQVATQVATGLGINIDELIKKQENPHNLSEAWAALTGKAAEFVNAYAEPAEGQTGSGEAQTGGDRSQSRRK